VKLPSRVVCCGALMWASSRPLNLESLQPFRQRRW
jgi:hypothetical protein